MQEDRHVFALSSQTQGQKNPKILTIGGQKRDWRTKHKVMLSHHVQKSDLLNTSPPARKNTKRKKKVPKERK
jgi:hypothetical protein